MTAPAVQAARFAAQLLAGPPATRVEEVVARLLAVQAQDGRGMRLAVRSRTAGLRASDVDRALTVDRSVVVSWLHRGTLHMVLAEDFWELHALLTPALATANARRLAQEGVSQADADRGAWVVARALADGPQTRAQLRERLAAAGLRVEGQALVHLLFFAALRGIAVRGPVVGAEQAFVAAADWVGPPPTGLDRERALVRLAERYLAGHGPATDRDLAKWAGLPLRDARRGLRGLADRLVEGPEGAVGLAAPSPEPATPPPRLLGPFDPLLLGWASREPVLGEHRSVVTVNGLFRPFALVEGRAVATWGVSAGRVRLSPLAPLEDEVRGALDAEAADVERFLGS